MPYPCLQKVDVLVNNAGRFPGKPGPTNGKIRASGAGLLTRFQDCACGSQMSEWLPIPAAHCIMHSTDFDPLKSSKAPRPTASWISKEGEQSPVPVAPSDAQDLVFEHCLTPQRLRRAQRLHMAQRPRRALVAHCMAPQRVHNSLCAYCAPPPASVQGQRLHRASVCTTLFACVGASRDLQRPA